MFLARAHLSFTVICASLCLLSPLARAQSPQPTITSDNYDLDLTTK